MKRLSVCFLSLFLIVLSCKNDDAVVPNNPPNDQTDSPEEEQQEPSGPNPLIQLEGRQIVDADKNPIYLQGVAFNNFIWNNSALPPEHHTELDYERVNAMGMNAIRFYMNYTYFEDDTSPYTYRQSGWDWLDENIAWAKKHGIYLILNMHAPQGGYQSQGEGDALWDVVENQNRLVALWKEIAERYKDEVQIAGFGPVNEPVPSQSMSQWSQLAQRLIDEIRTVDKNHLLFIEKAIYVQGDFTPDENLNFPEVTGENIVYEFHGYDPYFYSHQLLEFAELGDGGKYPDEQIIEVSNTEWYTATFDNPRLPAGTSDWTFFEGVRYTIDDPNIQVGTPALIAAEVAGRVFFDDIVVKEYGANGEFIRHVYEANLNSLDNWFYWSANDSGTSGLSTTEGNNDTSSLFIDGTNADSNLSNSAEIFEAIQGNSYQISGWMRGENVGANASSMFRLDFSTSNGPLLRRNKEYLEAVMGAVVDWAVAKNVALYMGEFGAGTPCFENDKGGLTWVADMYDILKTNDIHFTYHAYHEDAFGLYLGNNLPDPNNVNQPLIDWFTANLN